MGEAPGHADQRIPVDAYRTRASQAARVRDGEILLRRRLGGTQGIREAWLVLGAGKRLRHAWLDLLDRHQAPFSFLNFIDLALPGLGHVCVVARIAFDQPVTGYGRALAMFIEFEIPDRIKAAV